MYDPRTCYHTIKHIAIFDSSQAGQLESVQTDLLSIFEAEKLQN